MTGPSGPGAVLGAALAGPVGFGAMPLSTAGRPDRADAITTVHAALDAGARLLDTADAYCMGAADTGHNEELLAEALRTWDGPVDEVVVATKAGHVRGAEGSWHTDGRPEHLHAAAEASRRRLGLDVLPLLQFHRPDPDVPFERSIGALAELLDAGRVAAVGLSNVSVDQIEQARAIVPVTSVQNEFGLHRPDPAELAHCRDAGIAFLAWAPLGGAGGAEAVGERHPAAAAVAAERGVTAQQVALAWIVALGGVPLPGCRRPSTARASQAAGQLRLSVEELARLG